MKDVIFWLWNFFIMIVLFLALLSCIALVVRVLDLPLVYKSWSTQECVKVEPESAGTCEDLPDEYQNVWVR